MKNVKMNMLKILAVVLPIVAFVVNINANTIASPCNGQPVPPESIKRHRKF